MLAASPSERRPDRKMPTASSIESAAVLAQRKRIVEAAVACTQEHGPAKTTMEDVAARAGVARRTVYRMFAGKTELLEAIAVNRLDQLVERVRRKLAGCESLREALVLGSIEIVRLARADRVFMSVMAEAAQGELMLYFVDPATPVSRHSRRLWDDVFSRARAKGELLPGVADEDDLHNWLRSVHLVLFMRNDLDRQGQIGLLERFVLPGLVKASGGR